MLAMASGSPATSASAASAASAQRSAGSVAEKDRACDMDRLFDAQPGPFRGKAVFVGGLGDDLVGRLARSVTGARLDRSEEHTSELQSLMLFSYAVFYSHNTTS